MQAGFQAQLEQLRKRVAKIEARSVTPVQECRLGGTEVETASGKHLRVERVYPMDHLHGRMPVERLRDVPGKLVFLDTETTGLAGGTGTFAFLIGAASITERGFELRQWFLRDHGEEASALESLSEYLGRFDTVVTYNGRSYDQPLLETRYTLNRQRTPFGRLEHLDLLYGARRLWKLRFDSCRLVELEKQILGHERVGDVPGEMIPQLYFDYLRTGSSQRLEAVLEHNALDILSLAFLAAIIPPAFDDPLACHLKHGAELSGLARWLVAQERLEEAAQLYRRAVDAPISDELLFRSLWELSHVERRLERMTEALVIWTDLSQSKNAYRPEALVELAKYYEHKEKNFFMALECTLAARKLRDSVELQHRQGRLEGKISTPKTRRLL